MLSQTTFISYSLALTDIWRCSFKQKSLGKSLVPYFVPLGEEKVFCNLTPSVGICLSYGVTKAQKHPLKLIFSFLVISGHFTLRDMPRWFMKKVLF